MGKETTVFVRTSGATRGTAIRLAMAAVVVALTPILLPQRAEAQESFAADSDGYVPVYDVCFAGSEVGYYSWYNDGYTTYGEISIDTCLLDSYGAGTADYDRVLAHEQGHAAGLGHSSDPNDIMYPYTHIFQGGAQVEAPAEAEQYGEPETEQYEEPAEAEQYEEPEAEQYALDLSSEVQQYEPGQESDAAEEAPAVREAPREERPPLRMDNEEKRKQAEDRKKAEDKEKAEERKKAEKLDEAVDRVRAEAAALSRAVDGADALTEEETRNRAEALARTLEDGEASAKDGALAEARTAAKDMVASLTRIGEQAEDPAADRVQAVAETREKAEALAGALDRAGDNAQGDARAKDFDEASADVRAVASELVGAENELKDQEAEGQKAEDRDAGGQPSEVRSAAGQDAEQGVFTRIKEFLARTFA